METFTYKGRSQFPGVKDGDVFEVQEREGARFCSGQIYLNRELGGLFLVFWSEYFQVFRAVRADGEIILEVKDGSDPSWKRAIKQEGEKNG